MSSDCVILSQIDPCISSRYTPCVLVLRIESALPHHDTSRNTNSVHFFLVYSRIHAFDSGNQMLRRKKKIRRSRNRNHVLSTLTVTVAPFEFWGALGALLKVPNTLLPCTLPYPNHLPSICFAKVTTLSPGLPWSFRVFWSTQYSIEGIGDFDCQISSVFHCT